MTTFSTWTHPTTGQVRVYFNNFGQTKVWAEQCAVDTFGCDFAIRAVNNNRNRSELGNICNDAERSIYEAAGKRVKLFADVLALVA